MASRDYKGMSIMPSQPPTAAPYHVRKSEMTFWAKDDPIMNATGPTDTWTKMKMRAVDNQNGANPMGVSSIDQRISQGLDGKVGGRSSVRPRMNSKQWTDNTRTSYNERAKDGFQYWVIDRPKPTPYGSFGPEMPPEVFLDLVF